MSIQHRGECLKADRQSGGDGSVLLVIVLLSHDINAIEVEDLRLFTTTRTKLIPTTRTPRVRIRLHHDTAAPRTE